MSPGFETGGNDRIWNAPLTAFDVARRNTLNQVATAVVANVRVIFRSECSTLPPEF